LAQRHGIHLAKASELLTMEEAAPEIAKRLEIDARARLLKLDRVIYTAGGHPVEWRVALCSLKDDLLYLAEMD
jgi:DNA-binding GntR family transcriptional regulator